MRPRDDRRKLLLLLSTERYVPIEEIAAYLGTSKESAWTVISRLRARGVGIENVQGVGYRLNAKAPGYRRLPRAIARAQALAPGTPFGTELRVLRQQAGLSMTALARRAGMDPAHIQRAETRGIGVSREVVGAIADALDLGSEDRDRLLILAGYWPWSLDPTALDAVVSLARLLEDRPAAAKREAMVPAVRRLIAEGGALMVEHRRRGTGEGDG